MTTARSPAKQSPVHYKLAGATLVPWDGWLVAEHFGNPQEEAAAVRASLGLADFSFLPKWEIKGTGVEEFLASLRGGKVPSPGSVVTVDDSGYACRVSANHAVLVLHQEKSAIVERLPAANEKCLHAIERTSGFGCFLLCGPRARDLLNKLGSLDLRDKAFPDLHCAFGAVAATRALLVRRDRQGVPAYELFFSREFGEYLWDAVTEAGEEFHLRFFGLAAARLLGH